MLPDGTLPGWLRDSLLIALGVALAFTLLTAAVGVWPPFVAVESGSMEPALERGDLVLVTAPERLDPATADAAGVVTRSAADGYRRLGDRGDVVVFAPPGREGSPVIHRAMFHVEEGENWYDRADPAALPSSVDGCESLRYCPAPTAGYVTKGNANPYYDQAAGEFPPVRARWLRGEAREAVPWVGHLRLALAGR